MSSKPKSRKKSETKSKKKLATIKEDKEIKNDIKLI